QADVSPNHRKYSHAARGHDGQLQLAVVDLDQVDPFLLAAMQSNVTNRPRRPAIGHHLFAGDLPLFDRRRGARAEGHLMLWRWGTKLKEREQYGDVREHDSPSFRGNGSFRFL